MTEPEPVYEYFTRINLCKSLYGEIVLADAFEAKSNLSREVIIKVSSLRLLLQKTSFEGLEVNDDPLREANIMRAVSFSSNTHPNIIQMLDERYHLGKHYLVTEFAANGDLLNFMLRCGALPETLCRFFFRQIASALEYLHSKNVAHLDVSPENMLLDSKFSLKLADFGAAMFLPANGKKFVNTSKGAVEKNATWHLKSFWKNNSQAKQLMRFPWVSFSIIC